MEQSMIMRYITFFQENIGSANPEWIPQFEESIQTAIAKIDKYTPRDSRMVDEGKDRGYTDGYNQGLLEGHDNGWDEAKEYYHKIFERELREAKQQWKEEGPNEYFGEKPEEYKEVDDQWASYGQKRIHSREW
jgi:hypothetical protein